jgi:hypothetical protein
VYFVVKDAAHLSRPRHCREAAGPRRYSILPAGIVPLPSVCLPPQSDLLCLLPRGGREARRGERLVARVKAPEPLSSIGDQWLRSGTIVSRTAPQAGIRSE